MTLVSLIESLVGSTIDPNLVIDRLNASSNNQTFNLEAEVNALLKNENLQPLTFSKLVASIAKLKSLPQDLLRNAEALKFLSLLAKDSDSSNFNQISQLTNSRLFTKIL